MGYGGEPDTKCPECGVSSPCDGFDSVDIGVGEQRGNYSYECPIHGGFGWSYDGTLCWRDWDGETEIFEEDDEIAIFGEIDMKRKPTKTKKQRKIQAQLDVLSSTKDKSVARTAEGRLAGLVQASRK